MKIKNVILFASGSGSNAENIVRFFEDRPEVKFPLILSNRKDAFVHTRARNLNIPSKTFTREEFQSPEFIEELKGLSPDLIVLSGFLWLIPVDIVRSFPDMIINIHPALLPKYGGKGMYGLNVHRAVIENGEKESGITIHYVNERYDEGNIIFQAKCPVKKDDTPESLAERVHKLEYEHFPRIVERLLESS